MTIQMTIVFGALVTQMAIVAFVLVPLPYFVRSKIVRGWELLRQNSNFKVGLIFAGGMMILQFIDCLQKLQRFHKAQRMSSDDLPQMGGGLSPEQLASKFYAQRNLYLSGAVLYLGMSIHTVLLIVAKLVAKETALRTAQKESAKVPVENDDSALEAEIKKREVEIAAMKKQIEGVQQAYDALTATTERTKDE